MENKIKFFNYQDAKTIKLLEPKGKHFHFYNDLTKGIDSQSMICMDSDNCPICNYIKKEKKSFLLRSKIFILDIIEAFKKLIKNRVP